MQNDSRQSDVLTVSEVARILKCSRTHVCNAMSGKVAGLPRLTHLSFGRRKLIRRDWLEQWMDANKRQC